MTPGRKGDLNDGDRTGIPHLRRLWDRVTRGAGNAAAAEWAADQAVIHGLGLGLHETLRFLHERRPVFTVFESWALDRHGGIVGEELAARINGFVDLALTGGAAKPLAADFEPVFDETDLAFWDANGYVVLRGAAPPAACAAAAGAIWDFLGLDPNRPEGWADMPRCEGLFVPLTRHPAFEANRRIDRIRRTFAQLLGTEDLYVTTDRGGFNPPESCGRSFAGQGLHWDTSLVPPLPLDLQGLLYLTDTPAEQGAFQCVPGFHRRLEEWLAVLPPDADPRRQDLSAGAVRVPGDTGDLVLWHAGLPHGASPNRGARPRLVQYIACHAADRVDARPWL